MPKNQLKQSYSSIKCRYSGKRKKVIVGPLIAFFVFVFLFAIGEHTIAQEKDRAVLLAKAEAIARANTNLVPQNIEVEIKFFDRSGQQIRSESGTINLKVLPDGSIQSTYSGKHGPQSGSPQSRAPQSGGPPSGSAPSGKPPSGSPPGGGPPSGSPPSGSPPSGGPAGEGRMQKEQASKEAIEKISDLTDGNWVLELARTINPFYTFGQKEISFGSELTLTVDRGKECTSHPFVLQQGDLTVKGDMAIANNTGTPSKCTVTMHSNESTRTKAVVVMLYTYEPDTKRLYPSEITLVETTKKGLFSFRKETLSCRYKLDNFHSSSND